MLPMKPYSSMRRMANQYRTSDPPKNSKGGQLRHYLSSGTKRSRLSCVGATAFGVRIIGARLLGLWTSNFSIRSI